MYLLGYDVGSSSIKVSLLDATNGQVLASATSPEEELEMIAHQPGWAEQHPDTWWHHVVKATEKLNYYNQSLDLTQVKALGISYQMHGLVVVDENLKPLRPSIIWCDSRAVPYGQQAFEAIGEENCLTHYLNSPGNFTAAKLKWVMDHEPQTYEKIYKIMLPGDYIALRMTGEPTTTASGLSEGILWDFRNNQLNKSLMSYYGFERSFIPRIVETFSVHGELTTQAAEELGLQPGVKIAYRGGDQPNNAFSLNVVRPGEVAATAGTSGVIYGINDQQSYDMQSRVNTFVHVTDQPYARRYGVLACVNGTGIMNSWVKRLLNAGRHNPIDYPEMNEIASGAPVGSEGLMIMPFGNGAERPLENQEPGAQMHGLHFNQHGPAHFLRAAQEGVVFALNYAIEIMHEMGIRTDTIRVGHANMFLSPIFRETFAHVTGARLEMYNTDGAQGAARGAGLGAGVYKNFDEAFVGFQMEDAIEPDPQAAQPYREAYLNWLRTLTESLNKGILEEG